MKLLKATAFLISLFLFASISHAQTPTTPTPPVTQPNTPPPAAAPQLSVEQKDALRQKINAIQADLLQEYDNRDRYQKAQADLDKSLTQLNQELETLIQSYVKAQNVDVTKWGFDRGKLEFVALPPPKPAPAK